MKPATSRTTEESQTRSVQQDSSACLWLCSEVSRSDDGLPKPESEDGASKVIAKNQIQPPSDPALASVSGSAIHGATYHELDEANAKLLAENAALTEVMHWAQAVLTALNVGDIKSGSPLHLKLREVMISYRASMEESPNDPSSATR